MDQPSKQLTKVLLIFIACVLVIKSGTDAGFFEPKDYKGKGYYVKIPDGWKKMKKRKDLVYPQGVGVVMFIPKGEDIEGEVPKTYISILTKKLSSALWIEDEFPDILSSIRKSGNTIMDKGQIKLDDVISYWVAYNDKRVPALVLEFYMITDNSTFYKIQYTAPPDVFNKLRRSFEEMKASFKFRFSLY